HMAGQARPTTTTSGPVLAVIAPYALGDESGDEAATRKRGHTPLGLVVALLGRNAAYEFLFENIYEIGEPRMQGFSQVFDNPLAFRPPDLRHHSAVLIDASQALSSLADLERSRIELALRWVRQATYDVGVDS